MYPFRKTGFKTQQISIEVYNFNQFYHLNMWFFYLYFLAWYGSVVRYIWW